MGRNKEKRQPLLRRIASAGIRIRRQSNVSLCSSPDTEPDRSFDFTDEKYLSVGRAVRFLLAVCVTAVLASAALRAAFAVAVALKAGRKR